MKGLQKAVDQNGRTGQIWDFVPASGRYIVSLPPLPAAAAGTREPTGEPKHLALQRANLQQQVGGCWLLAGDGRSQNRSSCTLVDCEPGAAAATAGGIGGRKLPLMFVVDVVGLSAAAASILAQPDFTGAGTVRDSDGRWCFHLHVLASVGDCKSSDNVH